MNEFDYIVVGAGSAGSTVAGRLAATGRFRVLLLEAGPSDRSIWIQMPIGYGMSYYNPRVNWMYSTLPVPGLDDRVIYQPRGKVIGGSSSINAMVYSRGQPADYDEWAAMGNPGWAWSDVLACYKSMEDHALGASDLHGAGGPLHVTDIADSVHPLTHTFVKAGGEAGLPFNPDLNGASPEGVGYYQINTKGGFRMSAARAYLWPAVRSRRIKVLTGALATRIVLEGRRAVGVEYRKGGMMHVARAAAEVIVAGGAVNSPQLLQLSGIGPAGLLREHGIPVVCDSPAVGSNMQDHLCYDHAYRSRLPSLNEALLPLAGKIRVGLQYVLRRRGPLSLSVNQGGGFFRTRSDVERCDMQLYFSPLIIRAGVARRACPDEARSVPGLPRERFAVPSDESRHHPHRLARSDHATRDLAELSFHRRGRSGSAGRRSLPAAAGSDPVAERNHSRGIEAGPRLHRRFRPGRGHASARLLGVPPLRHLPDGTKARRRGGRRQVARARRRAASRHRCVDLPDHSLRQHQRPGNNDGRQGCRAAAVRCLSKS